MFSLLRTNYIGGFAKSFAKGKAITCLLNMAAGAGCIDGFAANKEQTKAQGSTQTDAGNEATAESISNDTNDLRSFNGTETACNGPGCTPEDLGMVKNKQPFNKQKEISARDANQGHNLLSVAGNVIGKIWNTPNTILGLTFGGIGHIAGWIMGTNPSISFGNNALQFHNNPLMPSAITLGNVIIYGPRTSPGDRNVHFQNTPSGHTVGQEEYRHTIQGQILGPFYIPAHIIGGVSSIFRAPNAGLRHPVDSWHSNNFMETGPMQDRVF
jgi:hypothetical protein